MIREIVYCMRRGFNSTLNCRRFVSLRRYVFPEISEKDLEEHFIHGSGPGGQNVNKATNCILLKHIPTGLWVKVHDSRSVVKNREIARQRLLLLLDDQVNGENSYSAQKKREEIELSDRKRVDRERRREMKAGFFKLLEEEEKRNAVNENDLTK